MTSDPVTPEVRRAVISRDGGCVAPLIDPDAGPCRDRWGHVRHRSVVPALTLDHVKDAPRMGVRAPSDPAHLVTLCAWHHLSTPWATSHRPELRAYLRSVNDAAVTSR